MKKGYITVYFTLIFMVLVSFVLSIFQGIKINAMKVKAECAFMAASNAVLGEYQEELLEWFDLFYVDTAYQSNRPDYHLTETHMWKYIEKNYQDEPVSVAITQITMATDNGGIPFRKQISDYMKDKMGLSYVEELKDLFWVVSKEGFLEEGVLNKGVISENVGESRWQETMSQMKEIPEDTWNKVEQYSPVKEYTEARNSFVLSQVISDASSISGKKMNSSKYVSNRSLITGSGTLESLDLQDKIFFIGYVFEKFSYYESESKTDGELDYEIEYLLGGMGSDYENLSKVAEKILLIRESMNLIYLLTDSEKMSLIKEVSAALSAVVLCPELAPVLEVVLVALWSYTESVADTKLLLMGEKVPLIKTKECWNTDIDSGLGLKTNLSNSSKNLSETDFSQGTAVEEGLSYKQYLELLLLFSDEKTITYRSMDLIEMHIQKMKGNENFRMDAMAEGFLVDIIYDIPRFGNYQIVRKFGYIS